jgi:hypothetical protein
MPMVSVIGCTYNQYESLYERVSALLTLSISFQQTMRLGYSGDFERKGTPVRAVREEAVVMR